MRKENDIRQNLKKKTKQHQNLKMSKTCLGIPKIKKTYIHQITWQGYATVLCGESLSFLC